MLVSPTPLHKRPTFTGLILEVTQMPPDKSWELLAKIRDSFEKGAWDELKLTGRSLESGPMRLRTAAAYCLEDNRKYLVVNSNTSSCSRRLTEERALAFKIANTPAYSQARFAFSKFMISLFNYWGPIKQANDKNNWCLGTEPEVVTLEGEKLSL